MKARLAALVMLFSVSALAEEERATPQNRVLVQKKTVVRFDGDELEGKVAKPHETVVTTRPKARFDSLLKTRQNFNEELRESTDAL